MTTAISLYKRLLFAGLCLLVTAALPFLANAQTLNDSGLSALLDEGDGHHQRYENQQAIDVYEEAREIAPEAFDVLSRLAETYNHLGNDFKSNGQKEEAEMAIRQAVAYAETMLELFPEEAQTYFLLAATSGNLALFQGGRDKVKTGGGVEGHCMRGLEIDPNHVGLLVAYGVFNREVAGLSWVERTFARTFFGAVPKGSMEQAVEVLTKATTLDPDHHLAHYELAVTYYAMGQRAEARSTFLEVVELPAQTSQDIRNRVIAQEMLGRMGS